MQSLGYIREPYTSRLEQDLRNQSFNNFGWNMEDTNTIVFSTNKIPIGQLENKLSTSEIDKFIPSHWRQGDEGRTLHQDTIAKFYPLLSSILTKTIKSSIPQVQHVQTTFPGFRQQKPLPPPNPKKLPVPTVWIIVDYDKNVFLKMIFSIHPFMDRKTSVQILRYVKWLDNHFPLMINHAINIFNTVILPAMIKKAENK